ncbi:hypothetical protein B0T11DRAFT_276219 [Plectosphaerella cucumerina]|uniref:TauD/TfdA-like domain-containing protein n=1 Tax=Plectosphaerella cucumerina TaxID=40658 RepID=A0A8K0X7H9_9PEZI|nr:hypothetical protein B0T11DRAFT_276219 [Plectosphaerella cucumerina]
MGVSIWFGDRFGRQAQDGQLMGHVADVKLEGVADEMRRPLYTSLSQPYHTDLLCGILAMCFLGVAEEGGQVLLSSAWTVYNEIAAKRPDVIDVLSRPDWVHDTFGRRPAFHERALLHRWGDKIALIFSRRTLTGSEATPRSPSIPGMTAAQAEALDMVHFTADAHRVAITPRPGDMFFVNNLAVLHSRTAFRNSARNRRYALRLWLDDAARGWGVPPGLKLAWERVFGEMPEVDDFVDVDPYAPRGRSDSPDGSPPRPPVRSTSCG